MKQGRRIGIIGGAGAGRTAVVAAMISMSLTSCCTSQKMSVKRINRMVDCNPSLIDDLRDTVTVTMRDTVLIPSTIVTGSVNVSESDTALITDIASGVEIEIITAPIIRPRDSIPNHSIDDPRPKYNIQATATIPADTVFVEKIITIPCGDAIVVDSVDADKIRLTWGLIGFTIGIVVILIVIRAVKFIVGKSN